MSFDRFLILNSYFIILWSGKGQNYCEQFKKYEQKSENLYDEL
jgi:thioredoxin-related protein